MLILVQIYWLLALNIVICRAIDVVFIVKLRTRMMRQVEVDEGMLRVQEERLGILVSLIGD